MTMLADQIRRIAPQYQPDADDLRWLTTELDRATEKTLPKLIRKRFVETLRLAGRNGVRAQVGSQAAKANTQAAAPSATANAVTK